MARTPVPRERVCSLPEADLRDNPGIADFAAEAAIIQVATGGSIGGALEWLRGNPCVSPLISPLSLGERQSRLNTKLSAS